MGFREVIGVEELDEILVFKIREAMRRETRDKEQESKAEVRDRKAHV